MGSIDITGYLQVAISISCIYFLVLGKGWAPAVMGNNHERSFLIAAQRGTNDTRSYWIGGRARWMSSSPYDPEPGTPEDWLDETISMFHLSNTHIIVRIQIQ